MKKLYFLWITVALMAPFNLIAQDGQLDSSFGGNGYVETDVFGLLDFGFSLAIQENENIVAAGSAEIELDKFVPVLVRYLPDGTLDPSFGSGGIVNTDFNTQFGIDAYYDVYIQDDQKIVAGGYVGSSSDHDIILSRFMVDGSLDPSFGINGTTIIDLGDDERFSEMGVMSDGAILTAGISKINGVAKITFVRLLPDGNLDLTFGDNGVLATTLSTPIGGDLMLQLLEDDSFLLGGKFGGGSALGKFDSNGSLDANFGDDGLVYLGISSFSVPFSITSEEHIVVGLNRSLGNDESEGVLKRFLANGTPDTSFGDNGLVTMSYENFRPKRIIIQPNQQILILGNSAYGIDSNDAVVTRYSSNGNLDTSFGSGGSSSSSEILGYDMLLQEDGKILSFGSSQFDWDFHLARYLNDPFTFGLQDQVLDNLTLFPNPSNGIFTVRYDDLLGLEIPFQLTDVTGKFVQEGKLSGSKTIINLKAASSGIYFLNTPNATLRLIKE